MVVVAMGVLVMGDEGEGGEVRAFRCERRNMLDLPMMQGAMATVLMAV